MSPFARKFKTKKAHTQSNKLVRLPDGTIYKCEKKVREQNVNDLRNVASKIGFERDLQFFFISKNTDGLNLLPTCFPRNPTALLDHISKIYFLYNLSEQSVSKCLSLENPKDLTDTRLLNDVVLTNRNNLQSNPEVANAAKAILDSEQAVVRLLTTLLSVPELTTQWYRVKDQTGKLCQLGITNNGLVLRPEFDGTEIGRVSWTDLGSPRIQRANIRVPLLSAEAATDPTVSSFVQRKKSKRLTLPRKKATQSQTTVREQGDVEYSRETLDAEDGLELVFSVPESSTAKRMAYQLNCSRSYAMSERGHGSSVPSANPADSTTQPSAGAFARFNRQFRDTFRRVAKPFNKKSKKTIDSDEHNVGSVDDLQPDLDVPKASCSMTAATVDVEARVSAPVAQPDPESPTQWPMSSFSQTETTTEPFASRIDTSSTTAPVPAVRTSVKTQQRTAAPPAAATALSSVTSSSTTSMVTTAPGSSSTITQTFHTSHTMSHGTTFQTHGSVTPVSSRVVQDVPTEPIGVVAAGEADFSLDECEDRMLHSLPSPVFNSTKVTRTSPTVAPDTGSSKVYSLGIKSSVIQPVTPKSPSSLTSFGAPTSPQSPSSASGSIRFDKSPTDESTAQVSAILAQSVKSREGPAITDSTLHTQMNATREFCTNILTKVTNPAMGENGHEPIVDTATSPTPSVSAATVVCKPKDIGSEMVVAAAATTNADGMGDSVQSTVQQPSSPVKASVTKDVSPLDTTSVISTKPVEVSRVHTDSLSSFGHTEGHSEISVASASHKSIMDSSPISETASTTISQLQTFSSATTYSGVVASAPAAMHDGSVSSEKTVSSVSSFGHSQVTSKLSADGNSPLSGTACASHTETTISPSTSFQSRLRPPAVSVARPSPSSDADALSRTPEFPTPYRPVVSGLVAPKIMPAGSTHGEQTARQSAKTNESDGTAREQPETNAGPTHTSPTSTFVPNSPQPRDVSPGPSGAGPTRISGIRPPSVKVPGSTSEQPQTGHATRPVSTNSPHAVTNGSGTTTGIVPPGRLSMQESTVTHVPHGPSQLKQPEVKVPASGIKPPSITVPTASAAPPQPVNGSSGLVRPSAVPQSNSVVASNGSSSHLGKNGSVPSSIPTNGPPTGIRPPSRVPKPNINRA